MRPSTRDPHAGLIATYLREMRQEAKRLRNPTLAPDAKRIAATRQTTAAARQGVARARQTA